ncbi:ankyrin repeat domain protein [Nitzschia inconspicua]|uniref:Ankyrin repeat domain protein n=1 Tax=Nitzschia inconspicua TaxID=303405 RepID=A0A9K3LFS7_9STRA|nr:ankyrin repeat domain protein [Nitzschia inconspicua]
MYKSTTTGSQASSCSPERREQEQQLPTNETRSEDDDSDNMADDPVRKGDTDANSGSSKSPFGFSIRPNSKVDSAASTNNRKTTMKNSSSNSGSTSSLPKSLPPLFLYMETGDFRRAAERAKNHPREVKTWASIKIKSSTSAGHQFTKRLALHQACFKLRSASSSNVGNHSTEDPFIDVCKFILLLVQLYPDAAGTRESRHGCLPLHLAAFASCIRSSSPNDDNNNDNDHNLLSTPTAAGLSPLSTFSTSSLQNTLPSPTASNHGSSARAALMKPRTLSHRSASESTTDTNHTTMTAVMAQEDGGMQSEEVPSHQRVRSHLSVSTTLSAANAMMMPSSSSQQTQSVSVGSNVVVSEEREEWAVKVLNALLDAFPRAIRMDSEGGRLPLHTAAAGRATPRVVATLVTANPAAARHRNKDGYLPLHIVAHWGQSDPLVAVTLLKAYPDATFGRNRWERTPLEEALCMAGENGRPHQAALVRALRKHPSYWTRPEGVLFRANSPRDGGRNIIDTDETVPSMDDSTLDDDDIFFDNGPSVRGNKKKDGEGVEASSPIVNDLPTLIRGRHWEAVLQRLELYPSDAKMPLRVQTMGGFLSTTDFFPLHYACERQPPVEVVQGLMRAYPDATMRRAMPGGALPIHIAATWYADELSVKALLNADRNMCKTLDELGNLPLHSACFSGTSTAVVENLLRAYPKAVLARNNQGSLPEDITKRLKHDNRLPTLALLNLCKEEVIAKRQEKHRRHRSDGFAVGSREVMVLDEPQGDQVKPEDVEIDNGGMTSDAVEVTYSSETGARDEELLWV